MKLKEYHIIIIFSAGMLFSCSTSRKFTTNYYDENKTLFQSVYDQYKKIFAKQPFSLHTKGKTFNQASLEIITDTMNFIYDFDPREKKLTDTLLKYRFDTVAVQTLISDMQKLNCTWITKLDYFENRQLKYLVFISIRHKELESLFKKNKYFTLAFFDVPQPSDTEGRLQDRRNRRNLRKINGANFYRINDKVFYSLSRNFR
jgi:hypothetical protein